MVLLQAIGLAVLTVVGILTIVTVFIKLMWFFGDKFDTAGEVIVLTVVAVVSFTIFWLLHLTK